MGAEGAWGKEQAHTEVESSVCVCVCVCACVCVVYVCVCVVCVHTLPDVWCVAAWHAGTFTTQPLLLPSVQEVAVSLAVKKDVADLMQLLT